jgi:hypothetical protein
MVTPVRIIVTICLIVVLCACPAGNIDTHPYRVGVLENGSLDEASGLAASRIHPDILWALNDSGSEPVLYAITTTGADSGRIAITGADNRDWEDLAAFTYRRKSYLAIGDVGDNTARRDDCTIYVIEEPAVYGKQARNRLKVKPAWQIAFRYEDGPRDCEAIAVDTTGQRILLLSKWAVPPVLYTLPLFPRKDRNDDIARRLKAISNIKNTAPGADHWADLLKQYLYRQKPTGMDISPDNRLLAILTYGYIFLYRRPAGHNWDTALNRPPETLSLPPLEQAESICFGHTGRNLFVTSERRPAPLLNIDLESF